MGCLFLLVVFSSNTLLAADKKETEILVDQATTIVEGFATDPNLDWFRAKVKEAKALLIIPQNLKGAFLVGGSGGSGVLLARDAKTGDWSYPGFYTLGAVSVGLQIGAEASEVILMVMTERGMEKMLTSNAKLGADMTVAAGPVGGGATAKTADILSYSRSKGAFAGLSVDGSVVKTRDARNEEYYGKAVSPTDIFIRRSVSNPQADSLRKTVAKIAAP
jgi:lipid-binding SYLF domain-containing protein